MNCWKMSNSNDLKSLTTAAATPEKVKNVKDHQIWVCYPLIPMGVRLEPPRHHLSFSNQLEKRVDTVVDTDEIFHGFHHYFFCFLENGLSKNSNFEFIKGPKLAIKRGLWLSIEDQEKLEKGSKNQ
ncbi:hypothetical protein H5410_027300, partial [Solanum commersonii]